MDDSATISAQLYRSLKDGSKYDRHIKGQSCDVTPMKVGDTFYTVKKIKEWVDSRLWHTEALSPLLAHKDLGKLADNIYNFLYNHIQYVADGELQNLKSPGCLWATREEGGDCKSFSIFASSILTNLGILHAIRQVKQPGYYADQYTHVYVVIPKNQNSKSIKKTDPVFVIDATRHYNTEVYYTEKDDTIMLPHQGLGKPSKGSCSSYGRTLKRSGSKLVRSTAGKGLVKCRGLNAAATNIDKMVWELNQLLNVMVSGSLTTQEVAKAIQDEAMFYINQGLEPEFAITPEGVQVGENFFYYTPTGLNRGLGAVPVALLAGLLGGGKKGENGQGGGGLSSITGALSSVLGGLDIGKNVGLVSKYGLSSWGAGTSPEDAHVIWAKLNEKKVAQLIDQIQNSNNPEAALNELQIYIDVIKDFATSLRDNYSKAKSTKLAHQWRIDKTNQIQREVIDQVVSALQQAGIQVNTYIKEYPRFSIPFDEGRTLVDASSRDGSLPSKFVQYSIKVPANFQSNLNVNKDVANAPNQNPTTSPTYSGSPQQYSGSYSQNTGQQQQISTGGQVQTASMGMLPMVAMAALAVGAFAMSKNKGTNKKTAKVTV